MDAAADEGLADPSEWDYPTNDAESGRHTPDNVFKGSRILVSWRCDIHGNFKREVRDRAASRGCPECQRADAKTQRRKTINASLKAKRALAAEGRGSAPPQRP